MSVDCFFYQKLLEALCIYSCCLLCLRSCRVLLFVSVWSCLVEVGSSRCSSVPDLCVMQLKFLQVLLPIQTSVFCAVILLCLR